MAFKDRLKELRKELGLTQEEFAKKIGYTRTAISAWEIGRNEPSNNDTIKLAEFFTCSVDYLLGKSNIRDPEKEFAMHFGQNVSSLSDKLFPIPVLGRVPAGEPLLADENIEGYLPIDPVMYNISNPDEYFFLKVIGESMNKLVKNGSYVLIQKQDTAENGDVIVALVNGDDEATLKRYKQLNEQFVMLEPVSEDSAYEPITVDLKSTTFKIIGKVVGDFKRWA